MRGWPTSPVVYEINTLVWLNELSEKANRRRTLRSVPQSELEHLAGYDFDAVWLMGVWQRSAGARKAARKTMQAECSRVLPDLRPEDIVASPYAILSYSVDRQFGGDDGLGALRQRLRKLGLRLILDFVPNHMAIDHEWTKDHPERLVRGSASDLADNRDKYFRGGAGAKRRIFARGRGLPHEVWSDTVQLDYRNADTRRAMLEVLLSLTEMCDGVRCDMAMLVTHDDFVRNWGGRFDPPGSEFWPEAIRQVKAENPGFLMMAEVYWDRERELLKQGFDYVYCKPCYDQLVLGDAASIVADLTKNEECQPRLVRFVENHDEPRAVEVFGLDRGRAAATVGLTLPGLRLVHDGQIEGRVKKVPVQLRRRPVEPLQPGIKRFYRHLLSALAEPVCREGEWGLLRPRQFSLGDLSYTNVVAFKWVMGEERWIVVANMWDSAVKCLLPLELPGSENNAWQFEDILTGTGFLCVGNELSEHGLGLEMPAYGHHLFDVRKSTVRCSRVVPRHEAAIYDLTWSPDGRCIAFAGEEGRIHVWDASRDQVCLYEAQPDVVSCVAWSPDGREIATGSHDGKVRSWDVANSTLLKVFPTHSSRVLSIAWSPDGKAIASASVDRLVHVTDVKSDERRLALGGHTDSVNCVRWSPDGRLLATGAGDDTVWLWDASTWEPRQELVGRDWVGSIAWSPDGRMLAVGTGDGSIDIWNSRTGRLVTVLRKHTKRVLCVAFSADGRILFSKSADGYVKLWLCATWEQLATLKETGTYLSGLATHPRCLMLASRDDGKHVVRVWDFSEYLFKRAGVRSGNRNEAQVR